MTQIHKQYIVVYVAAVLCTIFCFFKDLYIELNYLFSTTIPFTINHPDTQRHIHAIFHLHIA